MSAENQGEEQQEEKIDAAAVLRGITKIQEATAKRAAYLAQAKFYKTQQENLPRSLAQEQSILKKLMGGETPTQSEIEDYRLSAWPREHEAPIKSSYEEAKALWGSLDKEEKASCGHDGYDFEKNLKSPDQIILSRDQDLFIKMDKKRDALPGYIKGFSLLGSLFAALLFPITFLLKGMGLDAPYSFGIGLMYNAGLISSHTLVSQGLDSSLGLRAALPNAVIDAVVPKVPSEPLAGSLVRSDSLSSGSSRGNSSEQVVQKAEQQLAGQRQALGAASQRPQAEWRVQPADFKQGADSDLVCLGFLKKYELGKEKAVESWRIYLDTSDFYCCYYNVLTDSMAFSPPEGSEELVKSVLSAQSQLPRARS